MAIYIRKTTLLLAVTGHNCYIFNISIIIHQFINSSIHQYIRRIDTLEAKQQNIINTDYYNT